MGDLLTAFDTNAQILERERERENIWPLQSYTFLSLSHAPIPIAFSSHRLWYFQVRAPHVGMRPNRQTFHCVLFLFEELHFCIGHYIHALFYCHRSVRSVEEHVSLENIAKCCTAYLPRQAKPAGVNVPLKGRGNRYSSCLNKIKKVWRGHRYRVVLVQAIYMLIKAYLFKSA